jgi:hypothetical protein
VFELLLVKAAPPGPLAKGSIRGQACRGMRASARSPAVARGKAGQIPKVDLSEFVPAPAASKNGPAGTAPCYGGDRQAVYASPAASCAHAAGGIVGKALWARVETAACNELRRKRG